MSIKRRAEPDMSLIWIGKLLNLGSKKRDKILYFNFGRPITDKGQELRATVRS